MFSRVHSTHVLIQSSVATFHWRLPVLMSAREISADNRKRTEGGIRRGDGRGDGRGRGSHWKTQREMEKDKESDVRRLRVWSLPVVLGWRPKESSRIGPVPGHTEEPHAQKCVHMHTDSQKKTKQKQLTVENRGCENVNFIVQGPFVEAGLVRLRILSPHLPSTENINVLV